tara:strand:+ start:45 stop:725 length:681 start_codon:yes stop_codon:yes gene_type:complete
MKILSFDIGIKNLAYCVIDVDKNNKIEDWGILNISVEPVCEHILKDKRCDKTAKKIIGDKLLCSSHCKLKKYENEKMKNVKKIDGMMLKQGENMIKILDGKDNFLEVDVVCIENQPALKNPTMKSIQMMLYSYFLIKGTTNENSSIKNLEMINARNKLKAYDGEVVECDIKDKYKRTKYLGIKYCENMIVNEEQVYIDRFTISKKKDDLADSYLQGIFYSKFRLKQ